jgi:hypothetical protein
LRLILPMYCTCIGIHLPHTDMQHESTIRPGTEKPSNCPSALTTAGTGCMSCESTATVNPNIPENPFKGCARARILRDPAIIIDKVLVGRQECISATSSYPIPSRTSRPGMEAASHIGYRCQSRSNTTCNCHLYGRAVHVESNQRTINHKTSLSCGPFGEFGALGVGECEGEMGMIVGVCSLAVCGERGVRGGSVLAWR